MSVPKIARTAFYETKDYLKILCKSPHYIAVQKPPFTICQDEPENPASLSNLLRSKYPELFTTREHPFHAPKGVHRLDSLVTGCVLYGTSSYGTRQLAKSFRKRTLKKGYLALLSKTQAVTSALDHDDSGEITSEDRSTRWNVLARLTGRYNDNTIYVCWLQPKEGRNHQLRIHAAEDLRAPVMFDKHYARIFSTREHEDQASRLRDVYTQQAGEGIALHCGYMSFKLGLEQETVSALPPEFGIWSRIAREHKIDWTEILDRGALFCTNEDGNGT